MTKPFGNQVALILALTALLVACGGGSATPAPPVLAGDRVVFDSTRQSTNREIYVMKNDGTAITRLTNNSAYEQWWPRISPDRKKILFFRRPAGGRRESFCGLAK